MQITRNQFKKANTLSNQTQLFTKIFHRDYLSYTFPFSFLLLVKKYNSNLWFLSPKCVCYNKWTCKYATIAKCVSYIVRFLMYIKNMSVIVQNKSVYFEGMRTIRKRWAFFNIPCKYFQIPIVNNIVLLKKIVLISSPKKK